MKNSLVCANCCMKKQKCVNIFTIRHQRNNFHIRTLHLDIKVNQSRYRPGVAQMVPGS